MHPIPLYVQWRDLKFSGRLNLSRSLQSALDKNYNSSTTTYIKQKWTTRIRNYKRLVFCWASFSLDHSLNSLRHATNQLLDRFLWYRPPLALHLFFQLLYTFSNWKICHVTLYKRPKVLDWVEVRALGWPIDRVKCLILSEFWLIHR